jgi:hypothetical protein
MPVGRASREEVFKSLDQAREDLLIIGGLPEPTVFHDVWADIWVEETHNSTAIEGNTLRQKQIKLLLEDGVVSGSRAHPSLPGWQRQGRPALPLLLVGLGYPPAMGRRIQGEPASTESPSLF